MNKSSVSRRNFMKKSGQGLTALAALSASAPAVLSAKSPNEIIGTGHIGIGVRGGTLLTQVAGRQLGGGVEGTKVMAVCDVYGPHRQKGVERSMNPNVKAYTNYEDLLADPDVDVVVIASPDHWHSKMLIDAANAGKDVYIEKGWTRTIDEAKAMRAAVKKNDVIMQLGHQSRERTAGVQAKQLIQDGLLGPVTQVRVGRYENNPRGNNIWRWYGWYNYYERPNPRDVIENLDWKRWLGPASDKDFNMEHFWHWRCYWEYGTGVAGDLLSHEVDFVQYLLELGIPSTCMTMAHNNLLHDGREVPDTWTSVFEYHDEETTVNFDCSMNSCALEQPPELRGKDALMRFDSIAQSVNTFDVYPEYKTKKYQDLFAEGKAKQGQPYMSFDPNKTPPQPSHMQDFFNSVRSRKKTNCNEDQAFIESATLVMAVTALKEKRQVRWDKENEVVI